MARRGGQRWLRIITINDVYELGNLARLRTLVRWAEEQPPADRRLEQGYLAVGLEGGGLKGLGYGYYDDYHREETLRTLGSGGGGVGGRLGEGGARATPASQPMRRGPPLPRSVLPFVVRATSGFLV
jgi:hypothetical protein